MIGDRTVDSLDSAESITGRKHQRLGIAMVLVALWTIAIALPGIGARASYGAQVTGDEPQYLTTAISIAEDFSLDISDKLAERRFVPYHEINLNPQTIELDASGRQVSPHDPLLPALLALPMALGGWVAAKATLALVAGSAAAATLWFVVRRLSVPVGIAALIVGAFFGAPPLSVYATQVYPEMPAALCLIVGLAAVSGPLGRTGCTATLVSVIALAWLSIKYVPVAAVLSVALLVRLWPRSRLRALGHTAVLSVAGVVYLVFHRRSYGGWTSYASGDHFVNGEWLAVGHDPDYWGRTRRLAGLLLDNGFGLVAWTPAYLLTAAGLVLLLQHCRRIWAVALPAVAVGYGVATWVALTMHGWWWPGRQLVVVLPIVAASIAALVNRFRSLAIPTVAGCVAGTMSLYWLIVESWLGHQTLVTDFTGTANPFYRVWSLLLPDHRDFDSTAVTLTVVWSAMLVASAAWAWVRTNRRLVPGPLIG